MAEAISGTQIVGSQATPIALGATGGASDVGTWTHGRGQKALRVTVVDATNGALIPDASVTVTQPDANTIVLTNTTAGTLNVVAIVDWEIGTPQNAGEIPASAVVLA